MAGDRFLVVGIGASAGGVQALQTFFAAVPPDPGMAFIVVMHLGAGHESALPQILARSTGLPIAPVHDGAAIEPNRIYVLSSDAVPTLRRKRLRLSQHPAGGREYNTIDVFFASLAEDRSENAVAIILSGIGYDGTLGAKAIKERGGLTIAQTGDDAAPLYPQMPAHAIASGAIDLKLPVEQMAGKLLEYARGLGRLDPDGRGRTDRNRLADGRRAICEILNDRTGHDFTGYKERTFLRRIQRRMQVLDLDDLDDYVALLRQDRQEAINLFRDLLIGVTAFFRDPEAFDALADAGRAAAVRGQGSAGHDAGLGAGLLDRRGGVFARHPAARAHGTATVRPKASSSPPISTSRRSRSPAMPHYPAALLQDVGPERLDRFFTGDGISYAVAKEVRDLCIFSSHSVIRDPPFSRIDLISCRNLLIYLDRDLQNQLMPMFHYALRPGGFLFLGSSESADDAGRAVRPG